MGRRKHLPNNNLKMVVDLKVFVRMLFSPAHRHTEKEFSHSQTFHWNFILLSFSSLLFWKFFRLELNFNLLLNLNHRLADEWFFMNASNAQFSRKLANFFLAFIEVFFQFIFCNNYSLLMTQTSDDDDWCVDGLTRKLEESLEAEAAISPAKACPL